VVVARGCAVVHDTKVANIRIRLQYRDWDLLKVLIGEGESGHLRNRPSQSKEGLQSWVGTEEGDER